MRSSFQFLEGISETGVFCSLAAHPHRKEGRPSASAPCRSARSLGSLLIFPQDGLSLTCDRKAGRLCPLGRAALNTVLADECFYPGGATHLFLPFVTHSSATRRRSETLRDRPSPVVPFTVPNKESVSGTSQYLLHVQCQRWEGRVRNPCLRGSDREKQQRIELGERGTACFHFHLSLSLFSNFTSSKVAGRQILTYNYKSVIVTRDRGQVF